MADEVIGNLKVIVGMDTTEFVGKARSLNDKLKLLRSEMKGLQGATSQYAKGEKTLADQIANNRKQYQTHVDIIKQQSENLKNTKERLAKAKEEYEKYSSSLKDVNDLTQEQKDKLELLNSQKDQFNSKEQTSAQRIQNSVAQMQLLNAQYDDLRIKQGLQESKGYTLGNKWKEQGEKTQAFGRGLYKTGQAITQASALVGGGLIAMVKPAIDFEDAFAGVRKTVGDKATEADFKNMSDGFRQLSKELPISANELAKVGENAGQLGIHVPNILNFTETMAKLGQATNLSADEASGALARFANITQMDQNDFSRLGSSIVDLGNNFATTENDIVNMATQLAGAGHSVGLTEPQILGISTALSSVGIEAERGGSTFSKLMINMKVASETGLDQAKNLSDATGMSIRDLQLMSTNNTKAFKEVAQSVGMTTDEVKKIINASDDLQGFADVAGVTAEEFSRMFSTNPQEALALFVDGLAHASERGSSAVEVLDKMGISEVRLRDTLLRLGGAQGLFNSAIKTSTNAWKENTALNKEVAERNKTTASQIEIFKNKVIDLAISAGEKLLPALNKILDNSEGLLNGIKGVVDWFANLDTGIQTAIINFALFGVALGPILSILGNVTTVVGSIQSGIGGMIAGLSKASVIKNVLGGATTAVEGATGALGGLSTIIGSMSFAGWAVAIGVGVVALGGLVTLVQNLTKETRESKERISRWGTDVGKTYDDLLKKAKDLSADVDFKLNISTTDTGELVEGYKKTFQSYKDIVTESQKELDDIYGKLPQIAKDAATQEYNNRTSHLKDIQAKIQTNEDQINKVLQTASEERRALTQSEKEFIAKKQEESQALAVQTMRVGSQEQLEIIKRLSTDISNLDDKTLSARLENSKKSLDKLYELYQNNVINTKIALEQGLINQQKANEQYKALDDQFNADKEKAIATTYKLYEEQRKRIKEAISNTDDMEMKKGLEMQLDYLDGKMAKYFADYGVNLQEASEMSKRETQKQADDVKFLAKTTEDSLQNMNDNMQKANEHWNNLITDETTGHIKDNLKDVLSSAVETTDGWNALQYDIKHASLTTDAKETIKTVLEEKGKWDELDPEIKSFLTSTNAGQTLAEAIQKQGEWDNMTWAEKDAILHTTADDTQLKVIMAYEIWKDSDFREKMAKIDTNAPDSQRQINDLIAYWRNNHMNVKPANFTTNEQEVKSAMDRIKYKADEVKKERHIYFTAHYNENGVNGAIRQTQQMAIGYATGTQHHEGGLAVLGDGKRREPFLTPQGYFGVSPDVDTLYNLPRGTKVWSSINKFRNIAKYDSRLSGYIDQLPHFATGTSRSFLDNGRVPFNENTDFLNRLKSDIYIHNTNANTQPIITINISDIVVREEADINKLTNVIVDKMNRNTRFNNIARGTV